METLISIKNLAALSALVFAAPVAQAGTISVSARPNGAEVVIITQGDFDSCERRGLDAWDPHICREWRSLSRGPSYIGRYCVLAWWSGQSGVVRYRHAFKLALGVAEYALDVQPQPPSHRVYCR